MNLYESLHFCGSNTKASLLASWTLCSNNNLILVEKHLEKVDSSPFPVWSKTQKVRNFEFLYEMLKTIAFKWFIDAFYCYLIEELDVMYECEVILAHFSYQIHVDKYQNVERFKLSWNFKLKFILEKKNISPKWCITSGFSFIRTICCHVL